MPVANFVRREILRHLPGDTTDEVERLLLTATANPGLDEPDRIHFAILRIADGDLAAGETAPWDIWCHFAAVEGDGFRSLTPGQRVEVRYYCFPQESFLYVAKHVRPL